MDTQRRSKVLHSAEGEDASLRHMDDRAATDGRSSLSNSERCTKEIKELSPIEKILMNQFGLTLEEAASKREKAMLAFESS